MKLWLAAMGLVAGCTCGVPAVSNFNFPCGISGDCAAGYFCNNGTCTDAGTCSLGAVFLPCDPLTRNPMCCPVAAGVACLDLQTDPNNCGACSIVCPSGSCVNGQCNCGAGCPSFTDDGGVAAQFCDAGLCFCIGRADCGGAHVDSCDRNTHTCTISGD
jgi:hypothetical protein